MQEPPAPLTAEVIDAMWWLPKSSRSLMTRDLIREQQKAKVARALRKKIGD